jgi:hypothetical protein
MNPPTAHKKTMAATVLMTMLGFCTKNSNPLANWINTYMKAIASVNMKFSRLWSLAEVPWTKATGVIIHLKSYFVK